MNTKTLKSIIRQEIINEYFLTKTKARADLKKLPEKRPPNSALGKDVNRVIEVLTELDKQGASFSSYDNYLMRSGCEPLKDGMSRRAYIINSDMIVKLQKGVRPSQNLVEANPKQIAIFGDTIPAIYTASKLDKRWVICERVKPIESDSDLKIWLDKAGFVVLAKKMLAADKNLILKNDSPSMILELVIETIHYTGKQYKNINDFSKADFEEIKSIKSQISMFKEYETEAKDDKARQYYSNKIETLQDNLSEFSSSIENVQDSFNELYTEFHQNKYADALLRAQAVFSLNAFDIHQGNIGLTFGSERPVFLDTGYLMGYAQQNYYYD